MVTLYPDLSGALIRRLISPGRTVLFELSHLLAHEVPEHPVSLVHHAGVAGHPRGVSHFLGDGGGGRG